jgi:adenylate cyclase
MLISATSISRNTPAKYQSDIDLLSCLKALSMTQQTRQANLDVMRILKLHVELYPEDARALCVGSIAIIEAGDRKRSLHWAALALTINPQESVILYNVACTHSLLGEDERALECLAKAIRNGFCDEPWMTNDPDLASVRSLPRFQSLLKHLSGDTGRLGANDVRWSDFWCIKVRQWLALKTCVCSKSMKRRSGVAS